MTQDRCEPHPPITLIPLPQLRLSPRNVRKTPSEDSEAIEVLAATIAAEGLLQNLVVVPSPSKENERAGYEVVAGGRRWRALNLLASEGKLPQDFPVPCKVLSHTEAIAASLIENQMQAFMHPADQFEAFKALVDNGKSVGYVAALFGLSPRLVQRRLKLARLSPKLLALFREDKMTLEQLMSLTLSDDHETQERIWWGAPVWERSPFSLRKRITEQEVEAQHPLARCVGIAAYEAAGGFVRRDLFAEEEAGYLTDRSLLEQLAQKKLEAVASEVRAEGWAWVEVRMDYDYSEFSRYARIRPTRRPWTEAQEKTLKALHEQQDTLQAQIDALPDEVDPNDAAVLALEQQSVQLAEKIDAMDAAADDWAEDTLRQAGAVIFIGRDGGVQIQRGLVRPDDARPRASADQQTRAALPPKKPVHSEKLMRRLSAQRTAALQAELSKRPEIALVAITHRLVLSVFFRNSRYYHHSAVQVQSESTESLLARAAPDLESSQAWQTLNTQRTAWEKQLPEDGAALFGWLLKQSQDTLLSLLAFCTAATVNGVTVHDTAHPSEKIAQALSLDMGKWWQPTQDSYFMHVSKARIAEIVSEAVSKAEADKLMKMKKAEAAEAAQRLVSQTGWLPEGLRGKEPASTDTASPSGT